MGRGLPVWPILTTALAVGAANILLAYALSQPLMRGRGIELGPLGIGVLAVAALIFGWVSVAGWRSYLRRRRR